MFHFSVGLSLDKRTAASFNIGGAGKNGEVENDNTKTLGNVTACTHSRLCVFTKVVNVYKSRHVEGSNSYESRWKDVKRLVFFIFYYYFFTRFEL